MFTDYRDTLRSELERRRERNPAYSLRAMARDVGLAPSRLSEVLSGKAGLSSARAAAIADRLGLSGTERAAFLQQVRSRHARSPWAREDARRQLGQLPGGEVLHAITLDQFRLIADWYPNAILELTQVKGFRGQTRWIAQRLGLMPAQVESAARALRRAGLLSPRGWKPTHAHEATPTDIPSSAIRAHHTQILTRAERALHEHPVDQRAFGALTLAFDSARLPEAKRRITEFRRAFNREFALPAGEADRVFCLAVQFFAQDRVDLPKAKRKGKQK